MKFTKSNKEPKKTPEEEYIEQISTLSEGELRDLHKDLKIDHYGNSTAAVINTASGVGLLSMRSTTRRYRTGCMQIEAMEARMKDMGWTPHPNRYRDAVPIALGAAAGATAGMSFGLINVEKNAKRTKDFVKKKDLFKTKELVETGEDKVQIKTGDVETEEVAAVEQSDVAKDQTEFAQVPEASTGHVVVEQQITRKPLPAPATASLQVPVLQAEGLDIDVESSNLTEENAVVAANPITAKKPISSPEQTSAAELKKTKKKFLLSQVPVINKKMRALTFQKDKGEEETTTVSVVEIGYNAQSPVVGPDALVGHGVVEKLDSPPMYTAEARGCVA